MRQFITCILVFCYGFTYTQPANFQHFITREGGRLKDGDKPFRFISFNIPNLNYIEDEFGYEQEQPFRLPDAFEIRDALLSARQMGGTVVRLYTIPVARRGAHPQTPAYVMGPGAFDETALQNLDLVLAIAQELGIRVIIPFVNNWQWMGGRPQYADFRGKAHDDFWSDPQLRADIKSTIEAIINRKNTITGVLYKDDKTIFCWETGNELACPHNWTVEICRYIKSLDSNHLVMDGYIAIDGLNVRRESVSEPSIDLISSHHYENDPDQLIKHIRQNIDLIDGRKPYIVGEFGFVGTTAVERILDFIINEPIAGALIWSLRFHRREGGFYWHSEPLGHGLYKAYLWPGFYAGEAYDERGLLAVLRQKAFAIRDIAPAMPEPPLPPILLPIEQVSQISWQGSAGAAYYDLERATAPEGPWVVVGYHLSDADVQYFSLYNDHSASKDSSYYYRLKAWNMAGSSAYSNIVGPVLVKQKALIDNMLNYALLYRFRGKINIARGNDRNFREKHSRIYGRKGAELIYRLPEKIKTYRIYTFAKNTAKGLSISCSKDGQKTDAGLFSAKTLNAGANDYGYWDTVIYEGQAPEGDYNYLHIHFNGDLQIARVEVFY